MHYTITFSRGAIDENRDQGSLAKPISISPGDKHAYGLHVTGKLTVIYDPDGKHRAYAEIDGEFECRDIVRRPRKQPGTYYIFVQRDAVRAKKRAPCLTMRTGLRPSQYACRLILPEGGEILYTTDAPFLGNGVRLWIESTTEPQPLPNNEWYGDAYFRKCCGYRPRH